MMHSEDSTQDSVNSQTMGSVNGGTDDGYAFAQQEDSSQLSDIAGGGKLHDDAARDGMAYGLQDYYNQMGFTTAANDVAMPGLDSDNSNSRGFGTDDAQAQEYAEMMLQMQQQSQQNQVALEGDGSNSFNNDTRDSTNSLSQNPDPDTANSNGQSEAMLEQQQGLLLEEAEIGGVSKRKLNDVADDESNASATVNNADGEESNSGDSSTGPTPAKKALLEINVRKLLPDLEKHWKPVEDDPNDFQAWTYLLQYVDQEVRSVLY